MVGKIASVILLIFVGVFSQSVACASGEAPKRIPAESIKHGCALEFRQEQYSTETNSLGTQPNNIGVNWVCGDSRSSKIDRYNVEGGSPKIMTVFFWREDGFVVLVRWSIDSQAADFKGDFYKVYVYKYHPGGGIPPFIRQEKVMNEFGQGWDGVWKGATVAYPYKDASSIRRRLGQMEAW
jgi:hypothetical protein